jgi:predicted permease
VVAAYGLTSALVRIIESGRRPVELTVNPDGAVLVFTAAAMLGATSLFGALPALRAMAVAPQSSLRSAGRGGDSRAARAFRKSMVVAQVSLSVLLLSAAGLFLHHLSSLRSGLGFEREGLLLMRLEDRPPGSEAERLHPRLQELVRRLGSIPGVESVVMSAVTPLSGAGASRLATVEGYQEAPGQRRWISLNWVGPGYFETLGTPLLAGRDFSPADAQGFKPLIVNESMARYYFGQGNPLGKRVTFDGQTTPYEIVGVAADAKYQTAGESAPHTAYLHAFLEPQMFANEIAMRTRIAPASLTTAAREAAREFLPEAPVQSMRTMEQQVDATVVPERLVATLAGAFGLLGALLSGIGLYGLLGYMVARRTNEIGIRAALGATAADAVRIVAAEAAWVTAVGLAVGGAAALSARGLAGHVFAGLDAGAAGPILIGAAGIVLAALPAACAPAIRAARIDPMEALRRE